MGVLLLVVVEDPLRHVQYPAAGLDGLTGRHQRVILFVGSGFPSFLAYQPNGEMARPAIA